MVRLFRHYPTQEMKTPSSFLKWLAIAAIFGTGLIHVMEAPDALGEARYKGLLFIANGVGALMSAIGVYRNQRRIGWELGALISGASVLAYAASRTIGLPGLPAEPGAWFEPMGVASLACELLFVVLYFATGRARS